MKWIFTGVLMALVLTACAGNPPAPSSSADELEEATVSFEEEFADPLPDTAPEMASAEETPAAASEESSSAAVVNEEGKIVLSDDSCRDIFYRVQNSVEAIQNEEPISNGIEELIVKHENYVLDLPSLSLQTQRLDAFLQSVKDKKKDSVAVVRADGEAYKIEIYFYSGDGEEYSIEKITVGDGKLLRDTSAVKA